MSYKYIECASSVVPASIRFDVPRRHDGQIVEIAYGGFDRAAHDEGDPYKRVTDRSDGSVRYYRREDKP